LKSLNSIKISGREVLPIIEGGKGVSVTNWNSSGAFAAAGAVGTFSGVNSDSYDDNGKVIPQKYYGKTRKEKHEEMIKYSITGGITQAKKAYELAGGKGCLHMNVLWEMGSCETILTGILDETKGLVNGITCGAGMPYKVAEIADKYGVYYYPIVSSARTFRALWLRSYHKHKDLLGGVVYEDPWQAGGHNGFSNDESPDIPQNPRERVAKLRAQMNEFGLQNVPIIMAGGVWWISEFEDWLDDKEIAPVAFQFGTRPLLTKESPISDAWKKRLMTIKKGDVVINKFSPTGFYSSAVNNDFLKELTSRSEHQVPYSTEQTAEHSEDFKTGVVGNPVFLTKEDRKKVSDWQNQGLTKALRTPDSTLIFVSEEKAKEILADQAGCIGCLSACLFSNWSQRESGTTGRMADPRSFCIQKSLQIISHTSRTEDVLMFSGHNAFRFGEDEFYKNGFIPSVKQLVDRIATGF